MLLEQPQGSDNMKQAKVTTANYDIARNGIGRMIRHYLLHKVLPLGNYGGPRWNEVAVCWLLHRFGRPLCFLALLFDRPVTGFYRMLERRRKRRHKQAQTGSQRIVPPEAEV